MKHFIRKGIDKISKAYKENYAYGDIVAEITFSNFSCESEEWQEIDESKIPATVWEQFYEV